MTEDEWLDACADKPEDDLRRYAFADWLQERGDPRGELIRVQTEMRTLPAYADRYWLLKPRRNELLARVDQAWLGRLGYPPPYRPLFTEIPDGRRDRWRLVEEFLEHWEQPLAADDGFTDAEIRDLEERRGFRLPAALREWYALAGRRSIYRVCHYLWPLAEVRIDSDDELFTTPSNALVFYSVMQSDWHWGVRREDMGLDDPPVHELGNGRLASPELSLFVLSAVVQGVDSAAKGTFTMVEGDEVHAAFEEIKPTFHLCALPSVSSDTLLYEREDVIVEVLTSSRSYFITTRTEEGYNSLGERFLEVLEQE